jgi:predicted O-methyltransferase YrrM
VEEIQAERDPVRVGDLAANLVELEHADRIELLTLELGEALRTGVVPASRFDFIFHLAANPYIPTSVAGFPRLRNPSRLPIGEQDPTVSPPT